MALVWTGMRNSIAGHGSNASCKGFWENKDSTNTTSVSDRRGKIQRDALQFSMIRVLRLFLPFYHDFALNGTTSTNIYRCVLK